MYIEYYDHNVGNVGYETYENDTIKIHDSGTKELSLTIREVEDVAGVVGLRFLLEHVTLTTAYEQYNYTGILPDDYTDGINDEFKFPQYFNNPLLLSLKAFKNTGASLDKVTDVWKFRFLYSEIELRNLYDML